jgi:hypothetical protein
MKAQAAAPHSGLGDARKPPTRRIATGRNDHPVVRVFNGFPARRPE